jgi:hypothetical protein
MSISVSFGADCQFYAAANLQYLLFSHKLDFARQLTRWREFATRAFLQATSLSRFIKTARRTMRLIHAFIF